MAALPKPPASSRRRQSWFGWLFGNSRRDESVRLVQGELLVCDTPEAVLRLRDYVGDPTRFSLVLRALVTQGAVPDRGRFDALGLNICVVPAG